MNSPIRRRSVSLALACAATRWCESYPDIYIYTHTHTHICINIYIYIYICMYICVYI